MPSQRLESRGLPLLLLHATTELEDPGIVGVSLSVGASVVVVSGSSHSLHPPRRVACQVRECHDLLGGHLRVPTTTWACYTVCWSVLSAIVLLRVCIARALLCVGGA